MSNYKLTLVQLCSIFDSYTALESARIRNYVKLKGKMPSYAIKKNNKLMFDEDKFRDKTTLHDRMSLYATVNLYWIFRALGHTDTSLADLMSNKSTVFKSSTNWRIFIGSRLFELKDESNQTSFLVKPTYLSEFIRIGVKHIALLYRWNQFIIKDKTIFDENF